MKKISTDGLITEADIQQFKEEMKRGEFESRVVELIAQEPELVFFISEHQSEIVDALKFARLDERRMAKMQLHMTLMIWGTALLVSRAHRRQWDGLLPADDNDLTAEKES